MTVVELAMVAKAREYVNYLCYGVCKGSCITELEEMYCDYSIVKKSSESTAIDDSCILQKYI